MGKTLSLVALMGELQIYLAGLSSSLPQHGTLGSCLGVETLGGRAVVLMDSSGFLVATETQTGRCCSVDAPLF